jgi:hypothetical protein
MQCISICRDKQGDVVDLFSAGFSLFQLIFMILLGHISQCERSEVKEMNIPATIGI